MSITCAVDPTQKWFWGILGAQVIDRKPGHLHQNKLWRGLDRVLSFTCAAYPLQKYLWGTLGAQVIDRKVVYYFDRGSE